MGATEGAVLAPPVTSAPATEVAEPTAAEPTAAEPTAAEPTAAEPTAAQWPSHDEFGWDDWDGKAEALPEELQGWYGQFNQRWLRERGDLGDRYETAQSEADRYRRLYEALFTGEADPRVGELEHELAQFKAVQTAAQEEWAAKEQAYKDAIEADASRYMSWVQREYADQLNALTPEQHQQVLVAMDHFELHNALELMAMGEEAWTAAQALATKGADEDLIIRLIKAEHKKAAPAPGPAKPKANPASEIIAGAAPQVTPKEPPQTPIHKLSRREQLQRAARAAIANESRRR